MESKLIRIGNRIVNPSLITYAECTKDGKRVTVHLVTSSDRSNEKDVELTFSAQEAQAMWEELERISENAMPDTSD